MDGDEADDAAFKSRLSSSFIHLATLNTPLCNAKFASLVRSHR